MDNALLDLGENINLIPLAKLKKIDDLEVQPTKMQLQLIDRSIKYPYGVVGDVLVKVDKFTLLVDFVVMDIKEDEEVPLILGRPFMNTARIIIVLTKENFKIELKIRR